MPSTPASEAGGDRVPAVSRCRAAWAAGCLLAIYVAAWALSPLALPQGSSDLDVCFWPAAEVAASGHPLLIYAGQGFSGQCPDANGPLGLLPLVAVAAIANLMRQSTHVMVNTALSMAAGGALAVAMTAAAVFLIRRARGVVEWQLATWCVFLLAPVLWISLAAYGHVEQPLEVLLALLAVGFVAGERWALAGVALGLALLARTTALLPLIPLLLVPLSARRIKPAAALFVATAATAAIGLAPFLAADGSHTIYSLLTYRGQLPIGGGSLWLVAYNTGWAGLVERADGYLVLVIVAALCGATLRLRRSAASTITGLAGLLTVATACFAMFAKTVLPYYLFEPYVFGAVWWLARPERVLTWRVAVPLLLTGDAFLAKAGAMLPLNGAGMAEGVASSATLGLVIALVMADIWGGTRWHRATGTTAASEGSVGARPAAQQGH